MNQIYSPLLSCHTTWAASVQNDFLSGMNKFMAALTETCFQRKAQTVLYVPSEDLASKPLAELAQNRELVQRVESTLINWTRKIKDVLNSLSSDEVSLPLEEIQFWEVGSDAFCLVYPPN
jgi:dynein heavy chain